MFTVWHKSDYLKVPNEDRVMDTLRPLAHPPGDYMMPGRTAPSKCGRLRSSKSSRGPGHDVHGHAGRLDGDGKAARAWFLFSVVVGASRRWSRKRAAPRRK